MFEIIIGTSIGTATLIGAVIFLAKNYQKLRVWTQPTTFKRN